MLCHFARQFPGVAADFLERGRKLKRRFREETVTDLLMSSLVLFGGRRVLVQFPDEAMTGADMEWNFVDPYKRSFFRVLIQAKQIYGDTPTWRRHRYKQLLHQVGGQLQAKILCDTAAAQPATYPLFIFYHAEFTCSLAAGHGVEGLNLADGYAIGKLAVAATTRSLRIRNKSLGTIHPLLFPLSDLFCPSSVMPVAPIARAPGTPFGPLVFTTSAGRMTLGVPAPPSPHRIRERLMEIRFRDATIPLDLPPIPPVAEAIPHDVLAILAAYQGEGSAGAVPSTPRWRATFIAGDETATG